MMTVSPSWLHPSPPSQSPAVLTRRSLARWARWREAAGLGRRLIEREMEQLEAAGLARLESNLSALPADRNEWFEVPKTSICAGRTKREILDALADGLEIGGKRQEEVLARLVRLCGVNPGWQETWLERDLRERLGVAAEARPKRAVSDDAGTPLSHWAETRSEPAPVQGRSRTTTQILREVAAEVDRQEIDLARRPDPERVAALAATVGIHPTAAYKMLVTLREKRGVRLVDEKQIRAMEETEMSMATVLVPKGALNGTGERTEAPSQTAGVTPAPPHLTVRQQELYDALAAEGIDFFGTVSRVDLERIGAKLRPPMKYGNASYTLQEIRTKHKLAATREGKSEPVMASKPFRPGGAPTGSVVPEKPVVERSQPEPAPIPEGPTPRSEAVETTPAEAPPAAEERVATETTPAAEQAEIARLRALLEESNALAEERLVEIERLKARAATPDSPASLLEAGDRKTALLLAVGSYVNLEGLPIRRREIVLRLAADVLAFARSWGGSE